MKRSPKLMPAPGTARAYWKAFWAIGHFTVLAACGGSRFLDDLPEEAREKVIAPPLSWGAVRQGIAGLALRGVWAAARLGKTVLPSAKDRLRRASSELAVAHAGMELLALGVRHKGLRAECRKALGLSTRPTR